MDPLSIVSLLGTAVSLGDVVFKCITRLNSWRSKYHDAPLLISTLVGQLYMVQAALAQLSEWNQPAFRDNPRYRELAVQVDNSMDSFGPLIFALQQHLCQFDPDSMDCKSKFKALWNEDEMGGYSMLLDRQANALNLLLQAVRCPTWSEQNDMICREESQMILSYARDCSSSMVGLDDSVSVATETTAGLSIIFDFDAIILGSCIYQAAERSHLRQAIAAQRQMTGIWTKEIAPAAEPPSTHHSAAEVSEALAVNLNSHKNQSLLVVDHSSKAVEAEESEEEMPDGTNATEKGTVTAPVGHTQPTRMRYHYMPLVPVTNLDDTAPPAWIRPEASISYSHTEVLQKGKRSVNHIHHSASQEAVPMIPFYHRFLPNVRSSSRGGLMVVNGWSRQRLNAKFKRFNTKSNTDLRSRRELLISHPMNPVHAELPNVHLIQDETPSAADERSVHIRAIWEAVVRAVTAICRAMDRFEITFEDPINSCFPSGMYHRRSAGVAVVILALWEDGGFQRAYSRGHEYQLDEYASYYISNVERLASDDYVPTREDIIKAGISEGS